MDRLEFELGKNGRDEECVFITGNYADSEPVLTITEARALAAWLIDNGYGPEGK